MPSLPVRNDGRAVPPPETRDENFEEKPPIDWQRGEFVKEELLARSKGQTGEVVLKKVE